MYQGLENCRRWSKSTDSEYACEMWTWVDLTPSMKRAALENLSVVLRAAGSGLEHVIKANIYLTDMVNDFQPMNEVYAEVHSDRYPS
jgi:hypothetical protein